MNVDNQLKLEQQLHAQLHKQLEVAKQKAKKLRQLRNKNEQLAKRVKKLELV